MPDFSRFFMDNPGYRLSKGEFREFVEKNMSASEIQQSISNLKASYQVGSQAGYPIDQMLAILQQCLNKSQSSAGQPAAQSDQNRQLEKAQRQQQLEDLRRQQREAENERQKALEKYREKLLRDLASNQNPTNLRDLSKKLGSKSRKKCLEDLLDSQHPVTVSGSKVWGRKNPPSDKNSPSQIPSSKTPLKPKKDENPFLNKKVGELDGKLNQKNPESVCNSIKETIDTVKNGKHDLSPEYSEGIGPDNAKSQLLNEKLDNAEKFVDEFKSLSDELPEISEGILDNIKGKGEEIVSDIGDWLGGKVSDVFKEGKEVFNKLLDNDFFKLKSFTQITNDELLGKLKSWSGAGAVGDQMMNFVKTLNHDRPEIFNCSSFQDLLNAASGGALKKYGGIKSVFKNFIR